MSAESTEDITSPEGGMTAATSDALTQQEEDNQELLEPETDQITPTSDRGVLTNARYNLRHAVKPPDRLVQKVTVRDEHTS